MRKFFKIVGVALIFVGAPVWADQKNPELEQLFILLQDSNDPVEASVITQKIWENWYQTDDPTVEKLLEMGELSMRQGKLNDAVKFFSKIIELEPDFSEGWNRRATVYYMMGEYKLSTIDISQTLNLEPRHFGALSGQAMIYTMLNNRDQALKYYERALEVNPHLPGAKRSVELIKKSIAKEVI
jgi:tetratricopeptide (TPR) repeat protein